MLIVVLDLTHVTVDGEPAGSVTDLLCNYASVDGIRSAVLTALQAWASQRDADYASVVDQLVEAHRLAFEDQTAKHAAALASLEADHSTAIEGLQVTITGLQATEADLRNQVKALGGTELAQSLARDAERQRLLAAKAKAEADLAALDGGPSP